MHIQQMPPLWTEALPLRPKVKAEEFDLERLREASFDKKEHMQADHEAAGRHPSQDQQQRSNNRGEGASLRDSQRPDADVGKVEASPLKINLFV